MRPVAPSEREPVLDGLRGFAILGILLVNIEVMRGSEWLVLSAGGKPDTFAGADAIVQFIVGWLGATKFISSLAILFGGGAALIAARSLHNGESPRLLLARRYLWLSVFGAGHMLLFPGDVLFLYGLTGLALLAFVRLRAPLLLAWSAGLLVVFSGFSMAFTAAVAAIEPATPLDSGQPSYADAIDALRNRVIDAFSSGSFSDIASAQFAQAVFLQPSQLAVLPWVLALFLFGYALGRAGVLRRLEFNRDGLRRAALIGLGAGLPANLGLGFFGTLAGFGARPELASPWLTLWADVGQTLGGPLLAVGYLSALSLRFIDHGTPSCLAAVGRMALTAYLMQSALALVAFGALRLYDRLSSTSALLVVAVIWTVLLVMCPWWLRRFQLGPAEWLWRSLTYGHLQPLRREP